MLPIVIMMIVILVLAGLVLAYVAFPHRGEELPAAPWLGEALSRAAEAAPTVDRSASDGSDVADGQDDGVQRFFGDRRSGFFS